MDNQQKQYYCAIDLGTTNTAMAYGMINSRTGRLEAKPVPLKMKLAEGGIGRSNIIPSSVLIESDSSGKITPIIGPYAKHMKSISPEKVIISVKSSMGTDKIYEIENNKLTPADISSYILQFVLNNAKDHFHSVPDDLVITVPASFDSEMRTATLEAAKEAGIKLKNSDGTDRNILLDEPRAALYNFINSLDRGDMPDTILDITTPKNVLVYDLGGGTLDVSLHKIWKDENLEVKFEDYAISLHTLIGGDNFDDIFAQYLYKKIEPKIQNQIGEINEFEKEQIRSKLKFIAEKSKIEIAEIALNNKMMGIDEEIEIEIVQSSIFDSIGIDEIITEEDYLDIVSDLMGYEYTLDSVKSLEKGELRDSKNIIFPILDVLVKANEKAGHEVKVDAILLNGGMTKLPLIQKRLYNFFNIEPISIEDPDLSVALGGVYYHYKLHSGLQQKSILNDSIGIETNGGHVEHLAKAGVVLPYRSKVYDHFSVSQEGSTLIEFPFYIGSRNDTLSPNRKIATRSIRFKNCLHQGDKVSIQLEINLAGIVVTKIWVNNNEDEKFTMEVNSQAKEKEESPINKISIKPNPPTEYKDNDKNKVDLNILNSLKNLCTSYLKTRDARTKSTFMKSIKRIEKEIIQCTNKNEAIKHILKELEENNNYFYKERLAYIIGELMVSTGLNNEFYKYCKFELSTSNILLKVDNLKSNYCKFLIDALGKSRDSKVEPILNNILDISYNIKSYFIAAIISLGKVSNSLNTFKKICSYLNKKSGTCNIQILWALGKIGSREKADALDIKQIEVYISKIINIIKAYEHSNIRYNGVYALAEICDRRDSNNCINESLANSVLDVIKDLKNKSTTDNFTKILNIAQNTISGKQLSQEQTKYLLDIRTKLEI